MKTTVKICAMAALVAGGMPEAALLDLGQAKARGGAAVKGSGMGSAKPHFSGAARLKPPVTGSAGGGKKPPKPPVSAAAGGGKPPPIRPLTPIFNKAAKPPPTNKGGAPTPVLRMKGPTFTPPGI